MRYDKLIEGLLDGLAAGKTEQQISDKHGVSIEMVMQELERGTLVEMKHTSCSKTARKIAMDNLWKQPDYYIKLKQIG